MNPNESDTEVAISLDALAVNFGLLEAAVQRLSDVATVTGADLKYAREALGLERSNMALLLGYPNEHLEKLEVCKFACGFTRRALLDMLMSKISSGASGS